MSTRQFLVEITRWHQTTLGLLVFASIEGAAAYVLLLVAVDRGTLWWYVLVVILLVGVLQNVTKQIWKAFNGHKSSKA